MNFLQKNILSIESNLATKILTCKKHKKPIKNELFLKKITDNYSNYPALFIYGIGEYILELFKNDKLKHLIIFEDDLEVIYFIFKNYDLSDFLKNGKLKIYNSLDFNTQTAKLMFLNQNILFYHEIFTLLPFKNHNLKDFVEKICLETLENIKNAMHSSEHCLEGLEIFTKNLYTCLKNPSTKELLLKHKAKNKNAIIVASGPSLIKQLPLLKEIQNKVSIFCADGSYNILHEYGIKPDYIGNIEISTLPNIFFKKYFEDNNAIFLLSSTTNPNVIQTLQNHKKNIIITLTSSNFNHTFKLDDYGYSDTKFSSVANYLYHFAIGLGYTNIILIGQDLAYDENLNSHPKEFLHGSNLDTNRYEPIKTLAYGGKGEVYTHCVWELYKKAYEEDIQNNKHLITTYNATEGGARIEGAIEKPFKELCEELKQGKNKFFPKLEIYDDSRNYILSSIATLEKHIKTNIIFTSSCDLILKKIEPIIEKINLIAQNYTLEDALKNLDYNEIILAQEYIKTFKSLLFSQQNWESMSDILFTLLFANEPNFIKLQSLKTQNEQEQLINTLSYIINHQRYIKEIIDLLHQQRIILQNALSDIKNKSKVKT
ncbi:motility associated factor glycosyltransferase family protein [Campylobacter sp. RM16704]|uniref:motility associated factor glycosyltransferase family protein n=1 Tax=Campylobacter sp. RM16704 TaxID=1500960 RepID=UPI000581C540|nr:motility accessory factor [Campylobacter sp. RM16704]AJC85676.1 motility accessory factor [Campylobacter sp. RM16704]